jgi:hypothetical protein
LAQTDLALQVAFIDVFEKTTFLNLPQNNGTWQGGTDPTADPGGELIDVGDGMYLVKYR